MIQRSLRWRLPLIACILAIGLYYAIPPFDPDGSGPKDGKIKLGLDLQGGMQLLLRVELDKIEAKDRHDATSRAIEVVRNRIDQFGVAEPSIQQQGEDRILVQLPGISDRERALQLIGKTALLEFKLVEDDAAKTKAASQGGKVPSGYKLYKSEDGSPLLLETRTPLTGKYVSNAGVSFESQFNEPVVTLEFNPEGGKIFSDLTGDNVGRRLAIVLDGKVQSAPVINERIPSGQAQITGRFTMQEANDLAIVLRAGALPAPIVIEEERSVGASLGKDSVEQGVRAAMIGFAAVVAFMAIYYLFAGVVANVALALNILIVLAFMSYFKATMTMPGIAGIVLTIGMAVDTNVLIFERIREELALKKPVAAALAAGYKKAFTTILDSNLTSLITAGILYYIGTGPIRGFALTLAIGIVASMFTGIFVTRAIFDTFMLKGGLTGLPMLQIIKGQTKIDFLKPRRICYVLSVALIVAGAVAIAQRGASYYGVDFSGGSMQEYRFEKDVRIEDVRKSLAAAGHGTATIQMVAGTHQVIVRSALSSEDAIQTQLKKDFKENRFEVLRLESVGPAIGREIKQKSVWAFVFSLGAIWLYVAYRFDFKFALGSILALFHDGFVALAAVALTGRELSVPVLAAVLTILGYSINDTIVIFDRIRERKRAGVKETYEQLINISLNQTLSRTILTTLTVLMVVVSMFVFGGEVINDFAFTMLIGLISGTYSTVYIAAPVLADWPGRKTVR
ncbi:MAG: Protein translocase subunit SecDF [Candidatus Omnitrophica bacterium]|nr:Protein translocase subunit SecDF [Candidatus Omnitrophota bacterium]